MHEELLELARKVGAKAAALLMDRPPAFEIEEKTTAIDIVTQMDKKAETFIVQSILAKRPDDGMIGEEGAAIESTSGITWVIDPLDGTVNYFYGLPGWNVSIAAKDRDGSVVGVVTAPTINSTWWATRGGGAFFNGSKIKVNEPVEFDRAFIGTGFQYDVSHRVRQIEDVGALTDELEIPQRWYEAVQMMLAHKMSLELPQVAMDRIGYLEKMAEKHLYIAEQEERDRSPIYWAPNISVYTA